MELSIFIDNIILKIPSIISLCGKLMIHGLTHVQIMIMFCGSKIWRYIFNNAYTHVREHGVG
jgi:hypothetical protein